MSLLISLYKEAKLRGYSCSIQWNGLKTERQLVIRSSNAILIANSSRILYGRLFYKTPVLSSNRPKLALSF